MAGIRIVYAGTFTDTSLPTLDAGPLYSDTFNRAASTTSLGSTDGGTTGATAWTVLGSGVVAGIATTPTRAKGMQGGLGLAYIDVGHAGGTHQVTMVDFLANPSLGLAFRATDASNLLEVVPDHATGYILQKRVTGTRTTLASIAQAPVSGDVIKVQDNPATNQVTVFLNETQVAQITDTTFATSTFAGLRIAATSDSQSGFQNWSYTNGIV